MGKTLVRLGFAAVLLVTPLLGGCSEDEDADHNVALGGVGHRDGYRDPLHNCTSCHGPTLHGGSGPSCYGCHTTAGHTVNRAGKLHQPDDVDCTRCHGPAKTGGLGPACSNCHT